MCFSGRYTVTEIKKLIKGAGGLIDLLGTSDLREVERRMGAGDAEAAEVFDALAYQIAKAAAALLPAFEGEKLDRVILTGGMARSKLLVERIRRYLAGLGCGITVYPGENEMVALVKGALRVLYGREAAREYPRARASRDDRRHGPAAAAPGRGGPARRPAVRGRAWSRPRRRWPSSTPFPRAGCARSRPGPSARRPRARSWPTPPRSSRT